MMNLSLSTWILPQTLANNNNVMQPVHIDGKAVRCSEKGSKLDISSSVDVVPQRREGMIVPAAFHYRRKTWPRLYASGFLWLHWMVFAVPSARNCYLCLFYNWFHPVWLLGTRAHLDSLWQHNRPMNATCNILQFVLPSRLFPISL